MPELAGASSGWLRVCSFMCMRTPICCAWGVGEQRWAEGGQGLRQRQLLLLLQDVAKVNVTSVLSTYNENS